MKDTNRRLEEEITVLRRENERLQAEKSRLRESSERYRGFVEDAAEGFAEYDIQGRCVFCNESIAAQVGCTREEYMQRRHRDRLPSHEEANRALAVFREIYEKGESGRELYANIVCRDGSTRALEYNVTLVRDEKRNPSGFRCISRDATLRKQIEAESERYRAFVDDINDACYEFDLNGNVIFCNDSLPRIFGYSREDFMALDRWKRHENSEAARQVFRMYVDIYRKDIPFKILEFRIVRADGQVRDLETSVTLIRDAAGKPSGFRGIARDITRRKAFERERERYREFFENVEDVCAEYDLQGGCTFCNEAAVRLFGYPMETLLNFRHHERYPSREEADLVFNAVHEVYVRNLPMKVVVANVLCKNGQVKSVETSLSLIRDEKGSVVGFRSIGRDVTERRQMERELERYRDFMESIGDSCAEFDLRGRCIFCNEAAHRTLGYSRREYMQLRHHQRYASAQDTKQVYRIFHDLYLSGEEARIYKATLRCRDGTVKNLESIVTLIKDTRGEPAGFRNIGRDISARQKMEQEQEKLREELAQARKMEAVGTLAGGVAHDFNNLLMGIQGYTSLMLLNTEPFHPHYAQLKAIEAHVRSGADLTRQLLGYARGGRYEIKIVNLNEIASRAAEMFGRTKKEITVEQDLADDLWSVSADRGQLEQVILNLLVNAGQAMPGGGEIFIKSANVVMEPSHVHSLEIPAGSYVKLSVKDTGVGMDEITRERLFEPFFTTKEMGTVRGTGLGLASVYGIIKGHKGAINVQSEPGKGATFNIYLPATFREADPVADETTDMVPGGETILLVDDEDTVRDVVAQMIKGLGYRLLTAQSGEEALEIYRDNYGAIDLIIMDMIMPGMSGSAAIDAIREINPMVAIILSSGYSIDGEAQEIISKAGRISFIQKPFMMTELSQHIRNILDGKPQPADGQGYF